LQAIKSLTVTFVQQVGLLLSVRMNQIREATFGSGFVNLSGATRWARFSNRVAIPG